MLGNLAYLFVISLLATIHQQHFLLAMEWGMQCCGKMSINVYEHQLLLALLAKLPK